MSVEDTQRAAAATSKKNVCPKVHISPIRYNESA